MKLQGFIKWDVAPLLVLATEQFLLVVLQASVNLQLKELFKLISRHNEIVVDMFAFHAQFGKSWYVNVEATCEFPKK